MTRARPVPLDRLTVFAAVADAGGFTAAAERLGVTKTLVSQQIGKLEAELGGSLFTRTTRKVTLTEAGQLLLEECAPLLRELGAAVERFGQTSAEPTGTLRVTTSPEYAANVLGPLLAEFARAHPKLDVDLIATNQVLDLVADRIDMAVRFGWLRDSSLRAMQIGEFAQYAVASPDYLARHGTPKRPEDLTRHAWVALTLLRAPLSWSFTAPGGGERDVRVRATARGSSPEAVLGLVRGGAGVSVLAAYLVEDDVKSGKLIRLLSHWKLPTGGIHAVYPGGARVPVKVRAFIDFFRARTGLGASPRGR
ncbi:Transcriptional regulator, LysR family protein [Minicystis rosea]|nr:Transcriptional regulator, LysR family protein [Minicystis rosea]